MAVDTLCAAVHDPPGTAGQRFFDHDPGATDVHVLVDALRYVDLSERGCEMEHDLGADGALPDAVPVGDGSDPDVDPEFSELVGEQAGLVVQADDIVPILGESAHENDFP